MKIFFILINVLSLLLTSTAFSSDQIADDPVAKLAEEMRIDREQIKAACPSGHGGSIQIIKGQRTIKCDPPPTPELILRRLKSAKTSLYNTLLGMQKRLSKAQTDQEKAEAQRAIEDQLKVIESIDQKIAETKDLIDGRSAPKATVPTLEPEPVKLPELAPEPPPVRVQDTTPEEAKVPEKQVIPAPFFIEDQTQLHLRTPENELPGTKKKFLLINPLDFTSAFPTDPNPNSSTPPNPETLTAPAPEALIVPAQDAPRAPDAPEAPRAPDAPEAPRAPDAPEAPRAPDAPEAPRAPDAPPAAIAPVNCEEQLTSEINKLIESDKGNILALQYKMTALKLASITRKNNRYTIEGFTNKNKVKLKKHEEKILEGMRDLYNRYGLKEDHVILSEQITKLKNKKRMNYRYRETRKKISDIFASTVLKGLSIIEPKLGITDEDIAVSWISGQLDKSNGLSNAVAKYNGFAKNSKRKSTKEIKAEIKKIEDNLSIKFENAATSFRAKYSECQNMQVKGKCLSSSVLKNEYLELFSKRVIAIAERQPHTQEAKGPEDHAILSELIEGVIPEE